MYELEIPELIGRIPEIRQIYAMNDRQADELDAAVEGLENDIFIESMDGEKCLRWEKILKITPLDTDTLEDRRFRVRARVMERLPYSYRILLKKLRALCPDGVDMIVYGEEQHVVIRVALRSKAMFADVSAIAERVFPLNMTFTVMIMYNDWQKISRLRWSEINYLTWKRMKEDVLQ